MSEPTYIPRESPAYKPSSVLNFFLSFIPGAGPMYQGLLPRGAVLMAVFAGFIALTSFLSSFSYGFRASAWINSIGRLFQGACITGIIITYMYSFFDSLRTCRLIRSGSWNPDELNQLDINPSLPRFDFAKRGRVVAGIVFLAIGVLALSATLINNYIPQHVWDMYLRPAFDIAFPVALMILGAFLMLKGRKAKNAAE